ncbi:unnamed protein product [Mucor hiemalis]
MALTIDDVVTHYILSNHPKNRALIDIKNKKTGELRFIKIRHRLSKFYAVSLVDPVTFEVLAETQVKSASARIKPIILHLDDNKKDTPVELRDSSRIGFEWSFVWEGEKYRWVRESRMSNSLECKAIRKSGDICVAQYLPRMLKDEYFGIFSLLGYNMLRCNLTKSRELELLILMSLMTLLDKSDDGGWKKDSISKGVQEDIIGGGYNQTSTVEHNTNSNTNSDVLSFTYEDPIPKKSLQKKMCDDLKTNPVGPKNKPLSAGNSPSHTPKISPLPTPSVSTTNVESPRILTRQKSAGNLNYSRDTSFVINKDGTSTSTTTKTSGGRLSKIFSSLSQPKQTNVSAATVTPTDSKNTSPVDANKHTTIYESNDSIGNNMSKTNYGSDTIQQRKQKQVQRQQRPPQYDHPSYYDHQRSLPVGQLTRFTDDFGNLNLNGHYDNHLTSVRSIRWNPEPLLAPVQQTTSTAPPVNSNPNNTYLKRTPSGSRQLFTAQQIQHRSQSQDRRRPRVLDEHRRMSISEYPLYAYPPQPPHHPQHYGYIPQPTGTNKYNNRYSTSEYYAYQQQQQQYDYYQ